MWIDGWMDGQKDRQQCHSIIRPVTVYKTHVHTYVWTEIDKMDGRTGRQTGRQTDRQMWMDGWMDGHWIERKTAVPYHNTACDRCIKIENFVRQYISSNPIKWHSYEFPYPETFDKQCGTWKVGTNMFKLPESFVYTKSMFSPEKGAEKIPLSYVSILVYVNIQSVYNILVYVSISHVFTRSSFTNIKPSDVVPSTAMTVRTEIRPWTHQGRQIISHFYNRAIWTSIVHQLEIDHN